MGSPDSGNEAQSFGSQRAGRLSCTHLETVSRQRLANSGQTGDNTIVFSEDSSKALLYEAPDEADSHRGGYSEWVQDETANNSDVFNRVAYLCGDDNMIWNRFTKNRETLSSFSE